MGPLQWGDVPTAVATVFTGGAAWFAYQTIKSQRQQIGEQRQFIAEQSRFMAEQQQNLELEREELRAAAEYRRTAQAKRVSMRSVNAASLWNVTVTNDTDSAIRLVEVRFGAAYIASEVFEWRPLEEVGRQRGDNLMQLVDFVGAGRAVRFKSQTMSAAALHNNPPVLFFTDEGGARWSLTARGDLRPTDQRPGESPPAG
ncbi:hypothetical protein AB0465_11320 [Streptomyces griseoviridis]|uniref:hypothetical protein n=1 Tax=Streptomyces griseoviridis TaxID=45398 RepID=UPI00344E72A8